MTLTTPQRDTPSPSATPAESIFSRILIGVDGTKEGFDACRQASRLADPGATLEAATVVQLAPGPVDKLEQRGTETLAAASSILGPKAETRRLYGFVVEMLLAEATRVDATLLAIGTHEHPRLEEVIFGGVAGELLHQATCSVLIARPVPDAVNFPRQIVVGLDGSAESERAYEVAIQLALHRHSVVRGLVALGGKRVDSGPIFHRHSRATPSPSAPVRTLVEASACADLLIVGSRGLHGPRALGSVSERVAHQAACSVLVVR
ncbi:MAG TPA: universal stress protein [Gaiellaceae bacterium]|nr:universal stress protein [Gaiellaceae bacterium]